MSTNLTPVTLIGFGEVGQILASEMARLGSVVISAYDIAFARAGSPQLAAARQAGIRIAPSPGDAVRGAHLVISAVTAGAALDAARSFAGEVEPDAFILDMNSVAPATKRATADLFGGGGRYVEAAVMAPVAPNRLRTPILLGGAHAHAAESLLGALGFDAKFHSAEIGRASSVKMCRSIMVKGLEALMVECMLACDRYGVTDEVLASLSETFPGRDMHKFAGYLVSRALLHGRRRAEEMLEAAATVEDAGLTPTMTRPTAAVQAWAAQQAAQIDPAVFEKPDLARILALLTPNAEGAAGGKTAAQ
jgi:3-hydroxyisobutyrate dehydrogenase